jgi:hypothetical protein
MTYELAKQLKDAGFPNLDWMGYLTEVGIKDFEKDRRGSALSELIEACGDEFDYLQHNTIGVWTATDDHYTLGIGSTPEEATAKLWLALHSTSPANHS